MMDKTLAKKIKERADLKEQIDVLEYKLKQLEEEFKKDMSSRDGDKYEFEFEGEKHSISYKVFDQNKFDSKAFKEDHPDMYESYKRPVPSSRLTIK
jgi:predicted phage-related endonuclease